MQRSHAWGNVCFGNMLLLTSHRGLETCDTETDTVTVNSSLVAFVDVFSHLFTNHDQARALLQVGRNAANSWKGPGGPLRDTRDTLLRCNCPFMVTAAAVITVLETTTVSIYTIHWT
jgi:hypothetical protein